MSPSWVVFIYSTDAIHEDRTELAVIEGTPMEFSLPPVNRQRFVTLIREHAEKA